MAQATLSRTLFGEIGDTGLQRGYGTLAEEFLRELQGPRGMRVYREMSRNDAIIGAMLFAIEQLARQVKWLVEPARKGEQASERVAALLFLYFIAVLLFALIEREARQGMEQQGIEAIPLYPEQRPCTAPTCDGILQAFEGLRRTELLDSKGNVLRTFFDPLSAVAKQLLKLLHVSGKAYGV